MGRLVITGSEGLIGKFLQKKLASYKIIPLDISLGHDLTDENFVESFFASHLDLDSLIVLHSFNPLPVAGSKNVKPEEISLSELQDYFNVNLFSVFDVCRKFIKYNKKGKIINVSSIYGEVSPKHTLYTNFTKHIGYSLSKSCIPMLSKYLASYYPDVSINTIILGGIFEKHFDRDFVNKYSANCPKGRMMNLPEIASAFEFLLNPESSYITGTEIKIDGGWTAW